MNKAKWIVAAAAALALGLLTLPSFLTGGDDDSHESRPAGYRLRRHARPKGRRISR